MTGPISKVPSRDDLLQASTFGVTYKFTYGKPDHILESTSGDGSITYSREGVELNTDGSDDSAEIDVVEINQRELSSGWYYLLQGFPSFDDTGVAQLGGGFFHVDLINEELNVRGNTVELPVDIGRTNHIWKFYDAQAEQTVLYISNRIGMGSVTLNESIGSDRMILKAVFEDGDHNASIPYMGFMPLWEGR